MPAVSDADRAAAQGPLAGLKIVEYGDLVTAPYAAKVLADLGATVVKIEPPGAGDRSRGVGPFPNDDPHPERSGLFIYLNARKRGITLDLTTGTGQDIFRRLIEDADVLIENVAPQDSERLGLAPEAVRAANGRITHLSITPFGHRGPYSSHRGYGLNVAAMSGVVLATGDPERQPLPLPDFLEDYFTGVVGALGCMLALTGTDQDADGSGEWIDLSGAEAWMTFQMGIGMVTWLFGGRRTMRQGRHNRAGGYPYTILPCKDGEVRLIAMQKLEWVRFVDLMGNPEWAKDERFQDRLKMNTLYADELDALIQPWLDQRTKAELQELFYQGRVPFTPIKNFQDVLDDPHLRARDFFVQAEQPGLGTLEMPGPPYHFLTEPLAGWLPAPNLGEHNEEVYGEALGISHGDLVELRHAGVI